MLRYYIKNYSGKLCPQKQLLCQLNNNKLPNHIIGWIKQENTSILRKKRKTIRNPPGYELAHERGRENIKGYGYEHTNFVFINDHRIQHKFDNNGKCNKERPYDVYLL